MIHHADIEQTIIWHCIWSLPIARRVTHTHSHYISLKLVGVYLQVHTIVESLKHHKHKRAKKRQCARSEIVACLSAQIHDGSYQTYVNAVEEIASASITMLIIIANTSKVDAAHAALL